MHPDGGRPGTAGCTGLRPDRGPDGQDLPFDTSPFYEAIKDFGPSPDNKLPVIIDGSGGE